MLQTIIQALKAPTENHPEQLNYYAECTSNSLGIKLSVEGIGAIDLPLNEATINQLLHISEQAKFGWRDQTLTDTSIRNTQEIASHYVDVDFQPNILESILDETKEQLGLAAHTDLSAHLHNLLIYSPGQFFKPHRDSEKLEGMIATLVIILPCPHIGGDLLINHQKEQHRFVSEHLSQSGLKCVAFYADCYHEVEPVRQGYRVALTYNLVLHAGNMHNTSTENPALDTALTHYFTPATLDNTHLDTNLIYYFDHSYTEHSLRWDLLKGNDYHNACTFVQAAQRLNLVPHLALAEIYESWSTDGDEEDPMHEDLIDGNTCLNYWVDLNSHSVDYKNYYVDKNEVCWLTATEDLEPNKTEHEGWMGNYGNTVDYWYRRAAIVLWPKHAQIRMDFRLNHDKAMHNITQLIQEAGHEHEVRQIIEHVGDYFHPSIYSWEETPFIERYFQLALYVKDAKMALYILKKIRLHMLESTHSSLLALLQEHYGIAWCLSLLEQWSTKESHHRELNVIKNFSSLMASFIVHQLDTSLIEFIMNFQFNALVQYNEQWRTARPVDIKKSMPSRLNILDNFFQAAISCRNASFVKQLITYVITNATLYPVIELAPIFLQWDSHSFQKESCYDLLFTYITTTIEDELAKGLQTEEDKSINQNAWCTCEYCAIAHDFLHSSTEIKKIWPIRQEIRLHLIREFSGLDLPVTLTEERTGSPHKLIIVKNDTLVEIARTRFNMLSDYQSKLR